MKKQMSKTIEEYMNNNGWSSSLFLNHAKYLLENLGDKIQLKVGRTVIHMFTATRTIKFYVHHNGRSKEFLTITDVNGNELQTFHYSEPFDKVLNAVKEILDV